ncbi:MAG: PqqD family protein [Clostridia bacterium]|nr:PqqD family protein [Clostridia bacterium]
MKLKDGIILTEADGGFVAVDAGISGERFNGMLKLNETAGFIVNLLREGADSVDGIAKKICEKYDVDFETAKANAERVIKTLESVKLLAE